MVDCIETSQKNQNGASVGFFFACTLNFCANGRKQSECIISIKKIKKLFQNLLTKRYNTVIINVTVLYIAFRRENNG